MCLLLGHSVQTDHLTLYILKFCDLAIMPRLSNQDRAIAIGLLEANTLVEQVARRMGVSPNAIRKLRSKFQRTGEVKDLPRSGRPNVPTPGQDRLIVNLTCYDLLQNKVYSL